MIAAQGSEADTVVFKWSAYNGEFVRFERLPKTTQERLLPNFADRLVALEKDRSTIITSEEKEKHQSFKTRVALEKMDNAYRYVYTVVPSA